MTLLFANNAGSQLAQGINNTDDPVVFNVLDGSSFPSPGAGDSFMITLQGSSGAIEIMECTDRTGNQLTAVRAREGTTALPFSVGDAVDARNTAGIMDNFVQENSPIDMGNNPLSNANIDSSCQFIGGYMATQAYYDQVGTPETAIVYGTPGVAPTINGSPILTQDSAGASPTLDSFYKTVYPVGIVIFFATTEDPNNTAPTGVVWQPLADSADRDDAYLRMTANGVAAGNLAPGQSNDGATRTFVNPAAHTHSLEQRGAQFFTGGHALAENQMPGHDHQTVRDASDARYVKGGTGIPTGPTPIGQELLSGQRTGYAGGFGQDQNNKQGAAEHDHEIFPDGLHDHVVDDPKPKAMLVVPWQRTA